MNEISLTDLGYTEPYPGYYTHATLPVVRMSLEDGTWHVVGCGVYSTPHEVLAEWCRERIAYLDHAEAEAQERMTVATEALSDVMAKRFEMAMVLQRLEP